MSRNRHHAARRSAPRPTKRRPNASGAVSLVGASGSAPRSAAEAAIRSLQALAPTLHEHPDLLGEVEHVLHLAEARAVALETGNAASGLGTGLGFTGAVQLPDLTRESPTRSMPRVSAPSGYLGGWAGTREQPKGVMNAGILRQFARDPWVFAAKKHRAERIARADVEVVPADPDKPYNKDIQQQITRLLACPNELRDSYTSLMRRVVDDILVLDRGCLSKAMNARRLPTALYSEDGATIKIYAAWDGNPKTPRYLYEEPGGTRKVPLRNDELICIMESESTYSFGYSRVQILLDDIEADIQATLSAKDLVTHKPPPQAIQIPGASEQSLKRLRSEYETLIAGKRQVLFLGGEMPANFHSMVFSLRDNQWMEYTTYLARKICAVFQVSPQSIGITFDVNKATAGSQQEIEDDAGNIPLLLLLEEYLNRELLWDYAPLAKDGRPDFDALNLAVVFPEVSEASRILHIERLIDTAEKGLAGAPFLTLNMALSMLGEEPVAGGNTFYWMSPANGPIPWLSYDGEFGDFAPFGNAAVGGEEGAQAAAGGPDPEQETMEEAEAEGKKKPPAPPTASGPGGASGGPGGANLGGEGSSGNGAEPPFGSVDGKAAPLPSTPAPLLARAQGILARSGLGSGLVNELGSSLGSDRLLRRDTRRPGMRWSPAQFTRTPAAPHGSIPIAQYTQAQLGAEQARLAAQLEQLVAKAVDAALARNSRAARSLGRVSETTALTHHRPHAEEVARADLAAATKAVFEAAGQRGAHTLTHEHGAAHHGVALVPTDPRAHRH